jgi:ribosome recycling factor
MRRVRELVVEAAEGNTRAEDGFIQVIKKVEPEITKERRKELIKQFRDAVSHERQQRGL